MRKSFEVNFDKPENAKGRTLIDIPFNVWEIFNKKGVIAVKGSINGFPYKCNLLPRGKGMYSIVFTKAMQKSVGANYGECLSIIMELDNDITNKSEKEVIDIQESKKISEIKYVMQPNPAACGQACIAMLAGIEVEEAMKVMKTRGSTSIGQLIDALDYYRIKHSERNIRISKKNPTYSEASILTVHMPGYTHWVLYYKGKYYDPEFGVLDSCHPDGKITSFLDIDIY